MLRSIAIAALAAGAFLTASSTAASAATWQTDGENSSTNCTSSLVCPFLNHALNGNNVNVLGVQVTDVNLNLLTNGTNLTDVEETD
ncbi:hypothetical protein [Nonomuraea sediminis]|uniref:hypothetical protein n=1 Tax=Nonomuraea sediminis TaxID=2835864 RepID=UPI001BDC6BD4|nr:hypothetical protein [Nonomuraea sediminis]